MSPLQRVILRNLWVRLVVQPVTFGLYYLLDR